MLVLRPKDWREDPGRLLVKSGEIPPELAWPAPAAEAAPADTPAPEAGGRDEPLAAASVGVGPDPPAPSLGKDPSRGRVERPCTNTRDGWASPLLGAAAPPSAVAVLILYKAQVEYL